jgi:hypothetical protein
MGPKAMRDDTPPSLGVHEPARCHLWRVDDLSEEDFRAALQQVESVVDQSHLTKTLYRCKTCGQPYFGVWYELIDWNGDDDQAYEICVPVAGDDEIQRLKALMPPPMSLELLSVSPRLQFDGAGAARRVHWVGRGDR